MRDAAALLHPPDGRAGVFCPAAAIYQHGFLASTHPSVYTTGSSILCYRSLRPWSAVALCVFLHRHSFILILFLSTLIFLVRASVIS